jgi:NitT/TauT family transport system ATP-binding protein
MTTPLAVNLKKHAPSMSVVQRKDSDALIRVENVSLVYETVTGAQIVALNEVSINVRKNEFLAIVGPSGCGKSTLLKIIVGLLRPTSGEVWVGDRLVTGPHGDIGLVAQNSALLPWKSVLGNVLYSTDTLGINRSEALPRACALLKTVGLSDFADQLPRELSGGMQQRVSICRALVHNPSLLVMDEPFGALDAMTREDLGFELLRIWQEQVKTVIFVTHSIQEAVILADRVVVMGNRGGEIAKVVEIELQRPRDARTELLPDFAEYVHGIRSEINRSKANQRVE